MFFTDFYTSFYCFSYFSCQHLYFFLLIFWCFLLTFTLFLLIFLYSSPTFTLFFAGFDSPFFNFLTVFNCFLLFLRFCQCFCLFYGDPGRIAHPLGVSSLRSDHLRRPLRDRTSSYPCRLSHKKNLRSLGDFFLWRSRQDCTPFRCVFTSFRPPPASASRPNKFSSLPTFA